MRERPDIDEERWEQIVRPVWPLPHVYAGAVGPVSDAGLEQAAEGSSLDAGMAFVSRACAACADSTAASNIRRSSARACEDSLIVATRALARQR